jgi:hypothetical protein
MTNLESWKVREILARLTTKGFEPFLWKETPKGIRADQKGKITFPSEYTKNRVCLAHGNMAKLRYETHPGDQKKGIRILDVLPCIRCNNDVDDWLEEVSNSTEDR